MMKEKQATILVLLLALLATAFAVNRYTSSDPRGTLLVSEAVLESGTIKLDGYGKEALDRFGGAIQLKGTHYYYFFPIGTPLVSIPFVAIAKAFGFEMLLYERQMQIAIAAITSFATLLLLIRLARLFLDPVGALTLSGVFWFGTSLCSTCATALWSHNFASLFALLAIYSSIQVSENGMRQYWVILSVSLFLAYLCRPTMALLAPLLLLYIYSYSRVTALKASVLVACALAGFVAFSHAEFGQWLPDYYLPSRLGGGDMPKALWGDLFSPARGLLIHSPFLVVSWACYGFSRNNLKLRRSWLLIGLGWPLLHLAFISRFEHWWGGGSYGARLMTDALPGLFLLMVHTWPSFAQTARQKLSVFALALSCVFSIFSNCAQGLFNPYTVSWNAEPNVDENPEYLFDWNYPQFLANPSGHKKRLENHFPGIVIPFDTRQASFTGWSEPEVGHRWTNAKRSEISFVNGANSSKYYGQLFFDATTNGTQYVEISLNGRVLFSGQFDDIPVKMWHRYLEYPPVLLTEGENLLTFELPDARPPGNGDPRFLALSLMSLKLR